MVFGVNDRDQESVLAWAEQEGLPFPIILDKDRSIAIAYGMSKAGDERYLANPAEGRRPAVIIDEDGLILKSLPDLTSVDGQARPSPAWFRAGIQIQQFQRLSHAYSSARSDFELVLSSGRSCSPRFFKGKGLDMVLEFFFPLPKTMEALRDNEY